ncbi:MAG: UDP-3-O-(3-hydroxymyristoyl)glucosamine N-acyltransferase [Gemmatimonadota bacterium]
MPAGHGLTLAEAARLVGGQLHGPPEQTVRRVAPVGEAGPEDLALLASRRYLPRLQASQAGAVLTTAALVEACGERPCIVVPDAHRALRVLLERLHPEELRAPTIHPTAVLGRGVQLGSGVTIGAYVVVGEGARIEDDATLAPHVCIGAHCRVGARTRLHPHVVLYDGTEIGCDVIVHAGARLGVDGFGYVFEGGEHRKVPQVGGCVVEDRVEIGANTCVDRGSIGRTVIGAGTKIDNLVHVAHNVQVGAGCLLVAQVGIAGSTRLGRGVVLGGQAGLINHLEIGDGAQIAAQAGVIGDVAAGEVVMGFPARPRREFLRAQAAFNRAHAPRAKGRPDADAG